MQTLQAAVDLFGHFFRIPVIAVVIVAAFGEQKIFIAAPGCNLADFLFTVDIAFGGIDYVQTGIQSAVDQPLDSFLRHAAIADLGAAVIDIGGGSTELIVGDRAVPQLRSSYSLGTVRLLEQLHLNDPPAEWAIAHTRAGRRGEMFPPPGHRSNRRD